MYSFHLVPAELKVLTFFFSYFRLKISYLISYLYLLWLGNAFELQSPVLVRHRLLNSKFLQLAA